MIPGGHLRGQQEFETKEFKNIGVNMRETRDINPDTRLYVPVPAGCASFHHSLTLHASDENKTPYRRRAIAITHQAE
jgi:ectoine hydroxylase-related dioxygenase (phytanoyl-CoA dioxygenase family)